MTHSDTLIAGGLRQFQQKLAEAIEGDVHFDRFTRAMHATDASVYQLLPMGVVAPRNRADVIRTVTLCHDHGVSITARGGGTSQAGQSIGNGISLDFSRYMNRIIDLDLAARTVWVEPGWCSMNSTHSSNLTGCNCRLTLSTSSAPPLAA
ncbi:MAG: FAD-binding oxidoreductase [Caldilineaceae bacterium]